MILQLIFGLTGIIFGIILAYIAPEEVHPGKKYFLWVKRLLLLFIILFIINSILVIKNYLLFFIPLVLLILFLIKLKLKKNVVEIGVYLIFVLAFITLPQSLLAVLIFLYGLPTGTLLMRKYL